jgi:hypothetical protein
MGSIRRSPRNPDRWQARYRDPVGGERTKTFESKAAAKAFLAAVETDKKRGTWIDPRLAETPLAVVADELVKGDATKRSGSVARDVSILNNHILPGLGNKAVGAVSRGDVQNLVNAWIARYAPSTCGSALRLLTRPAFVCRDV